MRNAKENIIADLTLDFALEIIEYTEILEEHRINRLKKQLV